MRKVWVGAETDYSLRDPHMCVFHYLWHTLQSHQIIGGCCYRWNYFQVELRENQ